MVAYNFQKRFAPAVSSGEKTQTIRARRKSRHARPGEPVQLYTGMRTKGCRKLVDPDPICRSVQSVVISEKHGVLIDGCYIGNIWHQNCFARRDGFEDFESMKKWFAETHGLPFTGDLIMWNPIN